MVCGIHTRMGARAVPRRNECGREPTESHYGGKEEGCPWLVGSTALSAGTLEEGLVLNLAIASFAKPFILDSPAAHSARTSRRPPQLLLQCARTRSSCRLGQVGRVWPL